MVAGGQPFFFACYLTFTFTSGFLQYFRSIILSVFNKLSNFGTIISIIKEDCYKINAREDLFAIFLPNAHGVW